MHSKPGINHNNAIERLRPECKASLNQAEQNNRKIINRMVTKQLMRNEDDAIEILSAVLLLLLTYITCAFFNSPPFVASNTEVTVRNNAQVPISSLSNTRTRITKLISPKNVSENRCKMV